MISHSFLKEEDSNKESALSRFKKHFLLKMSLISYFAGERLITNIILSTIFIAATYTKFLGLICFNVKFIGIAEKPFNWIIKIINRTIFIIQYPKLFDAILILMFLFNLLYIAIFIFIIIKIKQNNNSKFVLVVITMYQLLNLINFWVLLSWENEMSLLVLINFKERPIFYKVLSVLNICISLFSAILYCFFGNKVEFNFDLKDYLARLDTSCEFYFFIAKLLMSVNFVVYLELTILEQKYDTNIYLGISSFISVLSLYFISFYALYYYNYIATLLLYFNISTLYANIIAIVIHNVKTLDGGDFMIFVGYVLFYPVSHVITNIHRNRTLSKIPFVELKKELPLCKYVLLLTYLVCVDNLSEENRLTLIGVVKQHQQNCVYENCVCKENNGTSLFIPKTNTEYIISNDNFSYESSKVYFKHLIIKEFEFLIKVTRNNNNNLIMMFSYYMLYYIGNFHTALYALINLKKNKNLNCQQRASLRRIFEMVRHRLQNINNAEMKRVTQDNNIEMFRVDFDNLILFYEKVTQLKIAINLALEFSTQFWTCIQNRVEIRLIKKNGLEFFKYHNIIEQTYNEIIAIFPNLTEVNMYYTRYKAAVFNELPHLYNQVSSIMGINNAAHHYQDARIDSEQEKFYHPKSVVVIANLTDRNKAIIEKITENVKTLLNYSPTECLGQEIKLLMPNIYKTTHNHFIQKHFESGRDIKVNHERFTFALHANYYAVPVMISVKMLSTYSNNVYYIAVLREMPLDYDFINTTAKGKIEMISKGIFHKIFNSLSISLYNSIDYYINFICKEYFNEMSQIHHSNYRITDFTVEPRKKYKYALLHFHSDSIIDNILRDFKKNENTNNNTLINGQQNISESPIMRILQMKEKIWENYEKDSIKMYAKIEKFDVFDGERLIMFKLYTNISADASINLDEIKLITKYINSHGKINENNNNIEHNDLNSKLLYGNANQVYNTNALVKRKINIDMNDLILPGLTPLGLSESIRTNTVNSGNINNTNSFPFNSSIKRFDKEQFKAYLSIKKRYQSKREYSEVKFIILYNVLFLVVMLTLATLNYIMNEKAILHIFNSLKTEYFSILPLFKNMAIINKNFYFISNRDKYFSSNDEDIDYISYLHNISINTAVDLTNELAELNTISYDFSNNILSLLNVSLIYHRDSYSPLNMTLSNYILSLVSLINSLNDIEMIQEDNVNLINLLLNIDVDFYVKLSNCFNHALNSTSDKVDNLVQSNSINSIVMIVLVFLFGIYVYLRILCFYCRQNNMIAMLLSIEYDDCDNILRLIRELKTIAQRKQNENESSAHGGNKPQDGEGVNNMLLNGDEKETLIQENNDDAQKIFERKATVKHNHKRKKEHVHKKKYNLNSKETYNGNGNNMTSNKNKISPKVYFSFLIRVFIICALNLSPFIYSLSYNFFSDKCKQILHLIQNLNVNQQTFIISYLFFQQLILTKTPDDNIIDLLNDSTAQMKQNQFETTTLFFDALNGFKLTQFEEFFSKNFCNGKDALFVTVIHHLVHTMNNLLCILQTLIWN